MRQLAIALILIICFTSISCNKNTQPKTPTTETHTKHKEGGIKWENWSDDIFKRAKAENKCVILDLEAVWCHWCHVMEEITYSEPEVIELISKNFIAVRVDQDSRPDLSNRYEDYGWPATIFFDPQGKEIVKRSGYIPPTPMVSLLKAIIEDPTPGPSVEAEPTLQLSENPFLSQEVIKEAKEIFINGYDFKQGGWGFSHKYMDWDSVEYCMTAASRKADKQAEEMAKQTLEAQLQLIDPIWGGVYQYSAGGTWKEPHFEKIMAMQAENMRVYALAYTLWGDSSHLKASQDIYRYLKAFLTSPEGAFYTSQDADLVKGQHSEDYFKLDDAARRAKGIPAVDKHIYARENGWVINALVTLYSATGEDKYLQDAKGAAKWIIDNRSLPKGGFRHDEKDKAGPYLGDSAAMGNAFLKLYMATGDREWLKRSEETIKFIQENFLSKDNSVLGFASSLIIPGGFTPKPQRDENILMVRFANLLHHYTGKEEHKKLAETGMRYLAIKEIATKRPPGGVLLTSLEMELDPAHVTIVGAKDDPSALALYKAALNYPSSYKRVEWFDSREGKLPNPDIEYPSLDKAAAFACANQRCSLPAFTPQDVKARVEKLNGSTNSTKKNG
ncbi:MAG: thioredoxin domain-containing protein [Acidobacteria bacterium]|nr:thioredoxin domain-containing protein [Acidobacteriota bacterium]